MPTASSQEPQLVPAEFIDRYFSALVFLTVSIATYVLYQNALSTGFFLDDATSIKQNKLVHEGEIWSLLERFKLRFVGYLTFWLNYQISGEDATAFRSVNLCIHAVNGFLVYYLANLLFEITYNSASKLKHGKWFAAGLALIFVIHPIQTQAVTYIVQRLASLVALFYFCALIFWIKARLAKSAVPRSLYSLAFVSCAILALFTKQNAFTLPIAVLLVEVLILRSLSLRFWLLFATSGAVLFLVAILFLWEYLPLLDSFTRETLAMSRWEYASRQAVVLWVYTSKFFWPFPLLLDYGYQLDQFPQSQILFAGLAHIVVLIASLSVAKRLPLVTFGVLFFYITHAVESGFIPISDLAFEHRNYLPLFGVLVAFAGLAIAARRYFSRNRVWLSGLYFLLLVLLAQATWSRNMMWADQEALLKQDVAANPDNTRAMYSLALWYQREVRYDESLELLRQIARANNGVLSSRQWTNVVATMINLQLFRDARELLESLMSQSLGRRAEAIFLRQYATVLTAMAEDANAVKSFEASMRVLPLDYDSSLAYGYSLVQLGKFDVARDHIRDMRQRFGPSPRLALLVKSLVIEYRRVREQRNLEVHQ